MKKIPVPDIKMFRCQTQSRLIPLTNIPGKKFSGETFSPKTKKTKNILLLLDNFSLYTKNHVKGTGTSPQKKSRGLPLFNDIGSNRSNKSNSSTSASVNTSFISPFTLQVISTEELILIEEKIIGILTSIKSGNYNLVTQCIEWWNNFVVSCIYTANFPSKDQDVRFLIKNACSLLMFSIILLYLSSFNSDNKGQENIDMMLYHHRIFLLICEELLSSLTTSSVSKEELPLLGKIKRQLKKYITRNERQDNSNIILNDLRLYCQYLNGSINNILKKFSSVQFLSHVNIEDMCTFYNNIKIKSLGEINQYFIWRIMRNLPDNTTFVNNTHYTSPLPTNDLSIPYLTFKSTKPLTLVIDLDETLIHFNCEGKQGNNITSGVIQYRPGLLDFLQNLSPFYEMVTFTIGTKQYADPILDTIEKTQKFFVKRLYREHTTIYQNDFVKDLSNLGRDLSKVIIIDDKPFNFFLQKENGIAIKPYWGTDMEYKKDIALLNLIPILINIAREKQTDVRVSIKKYKNDIIDKVSSCNYLTNLFN